MAASGISKQQILLIIATLVVGLAADASSGFVSQAVISIGFWGVLFHLLGRVDGDERCALMACLVIATAGEMVLSLLWGLYVYRLDNIPLFVPPGHALMLLLGISLARRLPQVAAAVIFGFVSIYSLGAATMGIDTLGVPLFLMLAAAFFAMPSQRSLFASTFMLSLALELYGTWLGNWTWAREVPGTALVTTNPPGASGAFYSVLDALVAVASLLIAGRMGARPARPSADMPRLLRTNVSLRGPAAPRGR